MGNLPIYPGASYDEPANDVAQPILGNFSPVNIGDGLKSGVLQAQFAIRNSTDGVLSSLMSNFFTRDPTCEHDTADLLGLAVVDCVSQITIPRAKFNGFALSFSKGSDISLMGQFLCAGVATMGTAIVTAPNWSNANLLRFNRATVHTGVAGFATSGGNMIRPYSVNASVMLNASPDMELDGTDFPSDFDAGMMTASLSMVFKAADSGINVNAPVVEGHQVVIRIANSDSSRWFELRFNYVKDQTPKNRMLSPPRLLRTHNYLCIARSAQEFVCSAAQQGF